MEYPDLFSLLQYISRMGEPAIYEEFFNQEEECPYGTEAYSTIQRGITIYREEIIQQEIPYDVHVRLHRIIRKRWEAYYEDHTNEGR